MPSMMPHITGMQHKFNTLEEWLYLGIKDAMSVGHKADFQHLHMFDFMHAGLTFMLLLEPVLHLGT